MTATITRALPRLCDGVDARLAQAIPEGICRTFRVLAYAHHDGRVLVAATDAGDPITERVVSERLPRPVLLVRHTAHEIIGAVDDSYPPAEDEVETPEARRSRQQMVRLLTRSGLVSDEQLRRAMLEHSRTGDPIGDILLSHGSLSEDLLVAALSELHQLQRVDLSGFEPDPALSRRLPEALARRLRALPVAEVDGDLLLAVARPLSSSAAAEVQRALSSPWRPLLAHRTDLDRLLQQVHRRHDTEVAVAGLQECDPERSAHVGLSPAQRAVTVGLGAVVVAGLVLRPSMTSTALIAVCTALYLLVSLHQVLLARRALGSPLEHEITDEQVAALDERRLPTYTILVPLHRESAVVPRLVRDLDALDYPRTRLDVKLLCEQDDLETIDAIGTLALPPHMHLVVVPDSQPRTRSKACNLGLRLATGDYCVVFDATDRPDPDQLKRALIAFDRAPDDVACVQARLRHREQDQNLLTSWAAVEHAVRFELVLPALGAARSPIPLAGSSAHLRTRTLRELGAWDPYNIAEGADLGLRLHREGHRTALVDSTTLTGATSDVDGWVRQRSRWTMGLLQTWAVHLRHPLRLLTQTGVRGFVSLNLTMGAVLLLLLNPVLWTLTTLAALTRWGVAGTVVPGPVCVAAGLMLLVGNLVQIHLALAGSLQSGDFGLARAAVLAPLSWALMSWAAWRGLLQLGTEPFLWEKTPRGRDEV